MKTVLESTETTGDAFEVAGGRYQLVVKDYAGEVTLQIEEPESDPLAWIDTDVVFEKNGVCAFWASQEAQYRVSAASAGATVYLQLISVLALREA